MNYCDYDELKHYPSGSFSSKFKTVLNGKLCEVEKAPLPEWMIDSFKGGYYKTYITLTDLVFYRLYGKILRKDNDQYKNGASKLGAFVSTEFAESLIDAKIRLALDPSWLNTRMYEAKILLPKGNIINVGVVAPIKLNTGTIIDGGADQVIMPRSWKENYIIGYRVVTTHQLINPPIYSINEPQEVIATDKLYKILACPYCGGSNVDLLSVKDRIRIIGSKGGKYTLKYRCNNSDCNYYW